LHRRHSRLVAVASQPGSAAGSRSLGNCSTSDSHTVCPTSSASARLNLKALQIDQTSDE
jgi:hypothetical protein